MSGRIGGARIGGARIDAARIDGSMGAPKGGGGANGGGRSRNGGGSVVPSPGDRIAPGGLMAPGGLISPGGPMAPDDLIASASDLRLRRPRAVLPSGGIKIRCARAGADSQRWRALSSSIVRVIAAMASSNATRRPSECTHQIASRIGTATRQLVMANRQRRLTSHLLAWSLG